MKRILIAGIFLSAFIGFCQNDEIQLPDDLSQINNDQLSQIVEQLGDARIIGTTERVHGFEEPFTFRNELIKYLVQNQRIDIILLESGLLESRHLNDYIHSKHPDIDQARMNGFSSGKQEIQKNIELLKWLRNYNSDPKKKHKIDIYGFDVSGSMGAGSSKSEMNTPVKTLISYLEKLVLTKESDLIEKLEPYVEYLKIKPFARNEKELATYDELDKETRNHITSTINDLISNMEVNRFEYIENTSEEEYNWAYVAAISARQIDNILRKLPLPGEKMTPEKVDNSFFTRLNSMAENVEYLLNRNPNSDFLIFGASNHLFKSPVETNWPGSIHPVTLPITVGRFLEHHYPDEYVLISHFYLKEENGENQLITDENILSNHLVREYTNYFSSLQSLNNLDINTKVKIDNENSLIPATAFDYIFFTERISLQPRKK